MEGSGNLFGGQVTPIRETIKQLPDDYGFTSPRGTISVADLKSLVSRLDDAEAVLAKMKCPCTGTVASATCPTNGMHVDASAYFERWK